MGWEPAADIPEDIPRRFNPQSTGALRTRAVHGRQRPAYLAKGGHLLIIQEFGGKEGLLIQHTATYLATRGAVAVGVVVDADEVGVARRVESFRTTYRAAFPHARDVVVGAVWGDKPRLGFWVAPDNESDGEMDDALVMAARRSREALVKAGETFIRSAEKEAPGKWTQKRSKALLGSVYQTEVPGAPLASALAAGKCWFDENITEIEPFGKLVKFIDAVGAPFPAASA
jgi:hypothetical protein